MDTMRALYLPESEPDGSHELDSANARVRPPPREPTPSPNTSLETLRTGNGTQLDLELGIRSSEAITLEPRHSVDITDNRSSGASQARDEPLQGENRWRRSAEDASSRASAEGRAQQARRLEVHLTSSALDHRDFVAQAAACLSAIAVTVKLCANTLPLAFKLWMLPYLLSWYSIQILLLLTQGRDVGQIFTAYTCTRVAELRHVSHNTAENRVFVFGGSLALLHFRLHLLLPPRLPEDGIKNALYFHINTTYFVSICGYILHSAIQGVLFQRPSSRFPEEWKSRVMHWGVLHLLVVGTPILYDWFEVSNVAQNSVLSGIESDLYLDLSILVYLVGLSCPPSTVLQVLPRLYFPRVSCFFNYLDRFWVALLGILCAVCFVAAYDESQSYQPSWVQWLG